MVNNFGGINHLPNQSSFERRNDYGSLKKPEHLDTSQNKLTKDSLPRYNSISKEEGFTSLDGRKWKTRDQSIAANQEFYKKIGREVRHQPDNPNAFNLTDFYGFNKD